jgi:hypothetical protein
VQADRVTVAVGRPIAPLFLPLARVGPTTPKRAPATALDEPTRSLQPGSCRIAKDGRDKTAVRFLAWSKRGTSFRTTSLLGGSKRRRRRSSRVHRGETQEGDAVGGALVALA